MSSADDPAEQLNARLKQKLAAEEIFDAVLAGIEHDVWPYDAWVRGHMLDAITALRDARYTEAKLLAIRAATPDEERSKSYQAPALGNVSVATLRLAFTHLRAEPLRESPANSAARLSN